MSARLFYLAVLSVLVDAIALVSALGCLANERDIISPRVILFMISIGVIGLIATTILNGDLRLLLRTLRVQSMEDD